MTAIRPSFPIGRFQSRDCEDRQRRQLTEKVKALEDRIEAMKTAGDDLAVCCTSVVNYADVQKFVAKWKASKEAKP